MSDLVPLAEIMTLLRHHFAGAPPTYNKFYTAFINGDLPLIVRRRGRLFVAREGLPILVRTFGLVERKSAEATAA